MMLSLVPPPPPPQHTQTHTHLFPVSHDTQTVLLPEKKIASNSLRILVSRVIPIHFLHLLLSWRIGVLLIKRVGVSGLRVLAASSMPRRPVLAFECITNRA